jgi:predicted dithiol-disulfide oxidoreductase (DUF899 family)
MQQTPLEKQIDALQQQIDESQKQLVELKQKWGEGDVQDYTLQGPDGPVKLSAAFGGHSLMVLVHNMGTKCPYCTLWADGFKSIYPYIEGGVPGGETKAAFIVVSPDEPKKQQEYAKARGWGFRMLSAKGTSLFKDLGYADEKNNPWPGVSILKKEGDKITRVARDFFGPGDRFNSVFSFFQLMPGSPMS